MATQKEKQKYMDTIDGIRGIRRVRDSLSDENRVAADKIVRDLVKTLPANLRVFLE